MARIAVFHNLPSGGAKRALHEWVKRLAERHTLDVYSLSTADHDYCDLRPYAAHHTVLPFEALGLFNSPFGRLNQLQRRRDLGRLQTLYRGLAEQIDAAGYDVVFSNPCSFTFIPLLHLSLKTPAVYYLHEHFPNRVQRSIPRPYEHRSSLRAAVDRLDPLIPLYYSRLASLQRRAAGGVASLLSNSAFTSRQLREDFGLPSQVVYLGVDSQGFQPLPETQRGGHVLSVGELSPRKGFDFVIESMALLPEEQRPALRLACNRQLPEERAYIEGLARQRGVHLEILSNLNSAQLNLEYNHAAALVYAPYLEPFGLVPLEAMACAAPVVAVAEGGVPESVVDGFTGRLTSRAPQAFAAAVAEVLANPATARAWGQNGRARVLERWTWQRSTDELERYLLDPQGGAAQ